MTTEAWTTIEDGLPPGWTWAHLGEVSSPVPQVVPSALFDDRFTYLDISSIDNQSHKLADAKHITSSEAPSRARQLVSTGDTLFSTVRTYLKNIAYVDERFDGQIASTGFCVLRPNNGIEGRYIFYYVLTRDFIDRISALQRGVSYPAVRDGDVRAQPIPVAPTNEQRRIAEKIDELFSQIEAGEQALVRAQKFLERHRQSLLNAAVTGELTREWREQHRGELESGEALLKRILLARREAWERAELAKMQAQGKPPIDDRWKQKYKEPKPPDTTELPELPDGWAWASPSQIAAFAPNSLAIGPFGSNLKVSDYRTEGVPVVFVRHIRACNFQDSDPKFVTKTKAEELSAHSARGGDLLITKMGDPPGDACLYPAQAPDAIITADCIKLTASELLPEKLFLVYAVNSEVGASQIRNMTTGVAQQKVSLERFSRFAFPVPSAEELSVIVDRVEQILSMRSSIEDAVNQAARQSSNLSQSILSAAFSGKLVPQDPADEPASLLLERIGEARAAAAQAASGKRAGRRGRPSKKGEPAMVKTRKEINRNHLRDILSASNGGMAAAALWNASGLDIDDFYKQLRDEVAAGHLREERDGGTSRIVCQ